ncbi:hypothetical protein BRC89_00965 [Halobacteriales archaeon QS_4_70_19]|nr:MAG: hypothetical protein BRC89_00965 [Halobacteriales archaeon QS_4_70_19]
MCTLILAWQAFENTPIAVAANRDEADERPTSSPAIRDGSDPSSPETAGETVDPELRYVAPRDERAGGTWIGYNEAGLFVGITNRWKPRAVEGGDYDPFHLVVADADAAILLAWDGHLQVRNLRPGVHVVVNVGWDGNYFVPEHRPDTGVQQAEDTDRVRQTLRPEPGGSAPEWTDRAAAVLGDHGYGRCIHGDGFGTQSSSLLRLGPEGAVYEYADGKPCETDYEPVAGFEGGLAGAAADPSGPQDG